jgi:hypothetical protein
MLTKIGNREMSSDTGYFIRIDGMFRLLYSEGECHYQINIEPLKDDPRGFDMMVESSSVKSISGPTGGDPVSASEIDRILQNVKEGLPVLGVSPWIYQK